MGTRIGGAEAAVEEILKQTASVISVGFEIAGVVVIVVGLVVAMARAAGILLRRRDATAAYEAVRSFFGRSVLLGLEVLVAADLIRTVAVAPTLDNLLVLALLVAIRTFLSWSLDIELEGVVPWHKREAERRERAEEAAS